MRSKTPSQWRVTMEHRNGLDQETFYLAAYSGHQAQKWSRHKLEAKGKKSRDYAMVGLARLAG
jgi:hypothetical protein